MIFRHPSVRHTTLDTRGRGVGGAFELAGHTFEGVDGPLRDPQQQLQRLAHERLFLRQHPHAGGNGNGGEALGRRLGQRVDGDEVALDALVIAKQR